MNNDAVEENMIPSFSYRQLEQIYHASIKEIKTKLEILDEEFHYLNDYNPIHHIESRLKSEDSLLRKLRGRNLSCTLENIEQNIFDVAGIRVITQYVDDIYMIEKLLTNQDDITVLKRKDYIKNPKEHGYRSLHLVVSIPIFLSTGKKNIPVEIQIRTIAMDFWASLEHHMRYKTTRDVPDSVRNELFECAKTISKLDHKMQGIHDQLTKKAE